MLPVRTYYRTHYSRRQPRINSSRTSQGNDHAAYYVDDTDLVKLDLRYDRAIHYGHVVLPLNLRTGSVSSKFDVTG
jgi:hypothetical protein